MIRPPMTQTDTLAAEYALGLLEGEDLLRARGMVASDPDFAAAVARWERQLAPLLDEVPAATPADGPVARNREAAGI